MGTIVSRMENFFYFSLSFINVWKYCLSVRHENYIL